MIGFMRGAHNMAPFPHCSTSNTISVCNTGSKIKLQESPRQSWGFTVFISHTMIHNRKQRYFISLGTAAMGALDFFIHRMVAEGIFDCYPNYHFIAIDSDWGAVNRFPALPVVQKSDRIHGWCLQTSQEDNIVTVFRDWVTHLNSSGVGGDRTRSIKALESVKKAIMQYVNFGCLATDAEFFVIGSAFGGTSTGSYLNVCEFINEQVRRLKTGNPAYKDVILKAFLLMPDTQHIEKYGYPLMTNMINFFLDIQCKSWQRRLENRWEGFKVPSWPLVDNGRFPLISFKDDFTKFGSEGSTLPWTSIYPIPTLNHSALHTQQYLAEMLLLESVVTIEPGICQIIDRCLMTWGSMGYPHEDECFTGFDFIAFKSGREPTIKKWFLTELQNSLKVLNTSGTADTG